MSLGALHRLIVVSSLGLNTLPHAAGVASIAATCKLNVKDFYGHVFWMSVIVPTLASFLLVILMGIGIQF
jgi:H+/gluconate symporter-like permease